MGRPLGLSILGGVKTIPLRQEKTALFYSILNGNFKSAFRTDYSTESQEP